jgi:GT2 family glycosyltransferase
LHYYAKENSGPGQSRNYGAERSNGEYVIILDSDVVLPVGYLQAVEDELKQKPCEAFGGPDSAHPSFTPVQKAISYSMTSFFTTGGIRGGKAKLDKFYPRSFNMGIRRDVYLQLGGFSKMRFGEDIDFSYRIVEAGYMPRLFPEAWVWHKRRTDFRKFFRQVYNSGIARINLEKRHPGTMKLVHLLPTVFTLGVIGLLIISLFWPLACVPIILYSAIILIDSSFKNKNAWVGILSIPAAFVQLMGYGFGFIESWWKRCVLKKDEFTAFEKNFYK